MNFSLDMLNWTAIGAITSLVMAIAAFATIYITVRQNNKDRRLQIKLIQQQQAQQKLDDMVENILNISHNINPFHVFHYSSKLTSNTFSIEDRQALEKLTIEDNLNNDNLSIQMIRLNNYEFAQPLLERLNRIRADYGHWSSTVSSLYQFIISSKESPLPVEVEGAVAQMIDEMVSKCLALDPQYKPYFVEILKTEKTSLDRALNVLKIYETVIAHYLQCQQKDLEKMLTQFVISEQKRINDILQD